MKTRPYLTGSIWLDPKTNAEFGNARRRHRERARAPRHITADLLKSLAPLLAQREEQRERPVTIQ